MAKPNRQHLPHAASLRRLAKGYRQDAKDYRQAGSHNLANAFQKIARRLDAEAKLLGELR